MRGTSSTSTGLSSASWALPFPNVRSASSGIGIDSIAMLNPSSLTSSHALSSSTRASLLSSSSFPRAASFSRIEVTKDIFFALSSSSTLSASASSYFFTRARASSCLVFNSSKDVVMSSSLDFIDANSRSVIVSASDTIVFSSSAIFSTSLLFPCVSQAHESSSWPPQAPPQSDSFSPNSRCSLHSSFSSIVHASQTGVRVSLSMKLTSIGRMFVAKGSPKTSTSFENQSILT